MVSATGRKYLSVATMVMSLFAFFGGVYFVGWGRELTSPAWEAIMSSPIGHVLSGTLFISGLLFVFGLSWERVWPRVIACGVCGSVYLSLGVYLGVAPLFWEKTMNGSWGIWILCGLLHILLAGLMWVERDYPERVGPQMWQKKTSE